MRMGSRRDSQSGRTRSRVAKVGVAPDRSISKATRLQGDLLTYCERNASLLARRRFSTANDAKNPRGLEKAGGFDGNLT